MSTIALPQPTTPTRGSGVDPVAALPDDRGAIRGHGGLGRLLQAGSRPSHQRIPGGQDDPEAPPRDRGRTVRRGAGPDHPAGPVPHPPGQADPAPRPGQRARARSLRRAGVDPRLRGPASRSRTTSPWSSRSPTPAWRTTASWPPRSTGRPGIPVYWIINLVHRQVEVYTDPGPGGYRSRVVFSEGQSVPVVIDGQPLGQIAVADILPSQRAGPNVEGNGA